MTRHVRCVLVLLIALLLVPFAPASGAPVPFDPAAGTDHHGRAVLEVGYADTGRAAFLEACVLRGAVWPIVPRDRDLRLLGQKGYRRAAC